MSVSRDENLGETTGIVRQDAVGRVLAGWRATRAARLVRRFRHGAGGTSLVCVNGRAVVLKAWPRDAPTTANLPSALGRMDVMRRRACRFPRCLSRASSPATTTCCMSACRGRWPARVSSGLLDEMIAVVDAERGAAARTGTHHWPACWVLAIPSSTSHLPSWPPIRSAVSYSVRRAGASAAATWAGCAPATSCTPTSLPRTPLPAAALLAGVVDWERCRIGDADLDLVGLLFDIDIGEKASPAVRQRLWSAMAGRVPPEVLALYVAIYAVRYASWAIGAPMEPDVLSLGGRLLRESAC